MKNQTIEKLYDMRLNTMAAAFEEQLKDSSMDELAFDERVAIMVDREWMARENRKLTTRLKQAKLKHHAKIEDMDFRHPRGLDKSLILTLANCHWIRNHQNVILTGPTGIGKSYIAEALVNKACCEGFTAICNKSTKLFRELEVARGDGSYSRYLSKMAKTNILVIEDWGFETLNDTQRVDLFEVIEDRHGIQSTIMISQYPVADWHNFVGEPTIADAILDRIVHNAHKISLQGESMRKTRAALTHASKP